MTPLLSITFIVTIGLLYKSLQWIPFLSIILNWFGLLIVFLSCSWLVAKWIHRYISSNLLGPLPSTGKAILITGCDSGFGYGSALKLNKLGFRVFAGCLFPDGKGAKSLKTSATFRDKIHIVKLDVTKDEDIESTYNLINDQLTKSGESLWGVVNNAGIPKAGKIEWGTFDSHYRQIFDVNVFGVIKVTRKMLPLLRTSSGRVVTIASINAKFTMPDTGAYSMTKAALIPFQDALRFEVEQFGIKVITIEPSFSTTPILNQSALDSLYIKTYDDSTKEVKDVYQDDNMLTNWQLYQSVPPRYLSMESTYEKVIDNIAKSFTDYEPSYRFPTCPPALLTFYSIYPIIPVELQHLLGRLVVRFSRTLKDKVQ